jgi:hypothetical protein
LKVADFTTFDKRVDLAAKGVFSVDRPEHRALRANQATALAHLDRAYASLGLDRKTEYASIAAEMEATMTDGVWARSTGEYAKRCHELDREMLDAAAGGTDRA